ncbi:MAG: tetratricopeptide repeat protein [Janthinobacterium lividum]
MNKSTYAVFGAGLMCLAFTSPLWAQGGPQSDGTGNTAKAGAGNQAANGASKDAPSDTTTIPEEEQDSMQKAYKDYTDKNFTLAASELQVIVKKYPNILEAHQMLGDIYIRLNQIPQAVPEMEAVVRLKPKDTGTRDNLGRAYLQLGDSDKAAKLYQTALAQKPTDPSYALMYAAALEQGGKHADAAAAFEKAAILDPKNSDAPLDAGVLYHQIGNDAKAVPYLKTALALGTPQKFTAYTALAEAATTAKQSKEAIQDYTLAAQAKPDDFGAEANLGVLEQNAGRKTDAEAAYRQAIALKSDDPKSKASVQANLAMLLTDDGKLDDAAALLVQATKADPTNGSLEDNLGNVYEKQGKRTLALAAYKQALAASPSNSMAKDGVARLSKP